MTGIDKVTQEKIVNLLSVLFPTAKIYLFGSRARGKSSKYSDIDLAVDVGKRIYFVDVGEARNVLSGLNIPYKIDVVDFHSVSPEMQKLILQDGILWKS